ncbi:MAG: leucine-rich repeat domain-containing protein, partial [Clostridiales bacterium]|nr:leucine-rich repeat domain-containing protein [Clostridiales bacterium]
YVIASILVVIAIGITIVGYSDLLSSKTDSKEAVNETLVDVSTETVDVSEEWRIASLDDFEYEYENDGITLGEYNGNSSCVIIPSSYEVEGTNLPVLALDDTFRGNENIINVIVSEGVTTISTGTFDNCSGLKHLYIPSTLSSIGYSLEKFESGEILYYGGTESEWLLIKQVSRSQIAFKKIVYNATEDDCKNNKDTYIEESVSDSSGIFSPLSNFAYDVQDGSLVLEDYCGDENCIVVASCYSVDGVECPVIELDNTFIHCRAETIIISEGVQTLSTALFNGCDATIIYLPSSVQDVSLSFWNYFHDLDTIYYGGTEEQFSALLDKKNRWDLDVKHIIYEATVEDVLNEIELDD